MIILLVKICSISLLKVINVIKKIKNLTFLKHFQSYFKITKRKIHKNYAYFHHRSLWNLPEQSRNVENVAKALACSSGAWHVYKTAGRLVSRSVFSEQSNRASLSLTTHNRGKAYQHQYQVSIQCQQTLFQRLSLFRCIFE